MIDEILLTKYGLGGQNKAADTLEMILSGIKEGTTFKLSHKRINIQILI
ncbi:hypothetical protein JFV29_00570 [Peribacillus sp. TH16]|nr:hypothetical protein [Peribacillus sp. TH16]MBK5480452.1 hypothetical protein [Peribacillus sp. TH16]